MSRKKAKSRDKKLERLELIKEQTARAAKVGMSPRRQISSEENFRVSASTPAQFTAGSTFVPSREVGVLNDADFQIAPDSSQIASMKLNIPRTGSQSPKVLGEIIAAQISDLTPEAYERVLPELVQQLTVLGANPRNNKVVAALQRKLSARAFGGKGFKDLRGKYGGARQSEA